MKMLFRFYKGKGDLEIVDSAYSKCIRTIFFFSNFERTYIMRTIWFLNDSVLAQLV